MNPGNYFSRKRILITGASSGIGAGLARSLASLGGSLILVGRDSDRLLAVAASCGGAVHTVVGDLTHNDTINKLRDVVDLVGVDIAILNAGIAAYDDADQFSSETFHRIMSTNVTAMVDCIDVVFPHLKSGYGHLVLVSSLAGYGGLPSAGAYCASKTAIRALAQSLNLDFRASGVPVTCVCPGFVKTPLTDLNRFPMPFLLSIDDAIERIVKGIAAQSHEVHFPKRLSLLLKCVHSLPAALQYRLIRWATQSRFPS